MIVRAAKVWDLARRGTVRFFASHGMVYSAAVAFNILLSSIPILFLVFAATSLLIGKEDLPFSQLSDLLKKTFPYGAQVLVPNLKRLFASGTTMGILGSVLLLFSSYNATDAIHTSLSVMIGTPRKKRIWRGAAFHVGFVLVLIVLTSSMIVVPHLWAGLSFFSIRVPRGWDPFFRMVIETAGDVGLAGIIFIGSVLSYRLLSPLRVKAGHALVGGLLFSFLLYAIKSGFTFYVKKFGRLNIIYGSLFGIVSFIIVTYLFAAAYLFCASIIGVLEERDGAAVPPREERGAG